MCLRQIMALACPGDLIVGFTTSGRSPNLLVGLSATRDAERRRPFSAGDGQSTGAYADQAVLVPSATTARIQEIHLLLLHLLSGLVDMWGRGLD
jgi:D-sedoheptulose 7-phosphate isomerase